MDSKARGKAEGRRQKAEGRKGMGRWGDGEMGGAKIQNPKFQIFPSSSLPIFYGKRLLPLSEVEGGDACLAPRFWLLLAPRFFHT